MSEDNKIRNKLYVKVLEGLLSKVENVKYILESTLDKTLLSNSDFSTLTPISVCNTSDDYKPPMESAFRLKLKNKDHYFQVYFILTDSSQNFSSAQLRTLSYMLSVWEDNYENKVPLEPVVPIIFYCADKQLNNHVSFLDHFKNNNKELISPYTPNLNYIILSYNGHLKSDEEIRQMLKQATSNKAISLIDELIFQDKKEKTGDAKEK